MSIKVVSAMKAAVQRYQSSRNAGLAASMLLLLAAAMDGRSLAEGQSWLPVLANPQ